MSVNPKDHVRQDGHELSAQPEFSMTVDTYPVINATVTADSGAAIR
jgi:hypothetical protein